MYQINISIDDISPHPRSSLKILAKLHHLITIFPNIKFTLFVPICYRRVRCEPNREYRKPYPIWEYPNFCKQLKNLDSKNFEVGYHGYLHGLGWESNNDEFKYITQQECQHKIDLMEEGVQKADLQKIFKPIFRPPGWKMSPDSIKTFYKNDFEILALSSQDIITPVYKGEQNKHPFKKINYYNNCPPFIPLNTNNKEVNIVYHASEWDRNYLDDIKVDELILFLKKIEKKEFVFM